MRVRPASISSYVCLGIDFEKLLISRSVAPRFLLRVLSELIVGIGLTSVLVFQGDTRSSNAAFPISTLTPQKRTYCLRAIVVSRNWSREETKVHALSSRNRGVGSRMVSSSILAAPVTQIPKAGCVYARTQSCSARPLHGTACRVGLQVALLQHFYSTQWKLVLRLMCVGLNGIRCANHVGGGLHTT